MKTGKKLLIVLLAIAALAAVAAGSSLGTIAYMTSASKVSNLFTVGNVKVTLDESVVDGDGKIVTTGERTDRNSYHLMPGKSYDKDPRITVAADTETCYIFLITRNQITDIEVQGDPEKLTMAEQMVQNGWGIYKDTTAGSRVWIYCGSAANVDAETKMAVKPVAVCGTDRASTANGETILVASNYIPVFTKFHITTDKSADLNIYSGAEVTINAVAIQSDSFGTAGAMNSVDAAWAAVVNQFPYIQDNVSSNVTPDEQE